MLDDALRQNLSHSESFIASEPFSTSFLEVGPHPIQNRPGIGLEFLGEAKPKISWSK